MNKRKLKSQEVEDMVIGSDEGEGEEVCDEPVSVLN